MESKIIKTYLNDYSSIELIPLQSSSANCRIVLRDGHKINHVRLLNVRATLSQYLIHTKYSSTRRSLR